MTRTRHSASVARKAAAKRVNTHLLRRLPHQLKTPDAYVVGGAVRDRLLKRSTPDLDIVIPAGPLAAARRVAKTFGGTAFLLDKERGTARVARPDGSTIDIAARQGTTMAADLAARDFTVNALAVPLAAFATPAWRRHLIDPHRGLDDLRKKIIRVIGPRVFREDPLRLLRAFRFAADLEFSIAAGTRAQIRRHRRLIHRSAPERIREEMLKLFTSGASAAQLVEMQRAGLLEMLLPETRPMVSTGVRYYGRGGVLTHTLDGLALFEALLCDLGSWFPGSAQKIQRYLAEPLGGFPRYAHLKWAILLHDIGKPATAKVIDGRLRFFDHEHRGAARIATIARRLRWSTEEAARQTRLVQNHMRPGNLAAQPEVSDRSIHRFFRELGEDAVGMLLVSLADHLTYLTPRERKTRRSPHEQLTRRMVRLFYHQTARVLPPKLLNGHEVMSIFGVPPSPLIGALLREVEEAQAEGTVTTREDALAHLRTHFDRIAGACPPGSQRPPGNQ